MDIHEIPEVFNILIVDDNPGDIRLIDVALKQSQSPNKLSMVKDGVEAIAFLRREGIYVNAIRPDIIILDLNLPRKNGKKVLAEIKNDPVLKRIPVIVFTASNSELDILNSYDLHANCYITKPISLEKFIEVVKAIEKFWLNIVKLPPVVNENGTHQNPSYRR